MAQQTVTNNHTLTAVEWLQEQLNPDMKTMQGNIMQELLEQAKQMEKEQIINAHTRAYLIGEDTISIEDANNASEQYYNETYGK